MAMKNRNKKEGRVEVKKFKIFGLGLIGIILIIISVNFISAATYYWVGASNGRWANASSWASSSGGAGGAGIPG